MRLAHKLLLLFVLFSVIPFIVAGYLYFRSGQNTIEITTINHLVSTNILKKAEIGTWMLNGAKLLAILVNNPFFKRDFASEMVTHNPNDPRHLAVHKRIIEDYLSPVINEGTFFELFIMRASDGMVLISTDEKQTGKYFENQPFFIQGKRDVFIQNVYYSMAIQEVALTISAPLKDEQGYVLAVMAGRANLSELSTIIEQRSGLSQTEDTYLVNKFNYFVTDPRFGQGFALKKSIHTDGVDAAIAKRTGIGFYNDYRDVPVIGAYNWIPEWDLCIITEIDQAEAYAPVYSLRRSISIFGLVVGILAALSGWLCTVSIIMPVKDLVKATEEIARGNLDYKVSRRRNDEIGVLSKAFEKMSQSLKDTLVSRNQLQEEVTERKKAEQNLERQRELLHGIIDSIPVMLTIHAPNLQTFRFNKEFIKVLGWTEEDMTDIDLMEKLYSDPGQRGLAKELMISRSSDWRDFIVTAKDGSIVDSSWANIRLADDTRVSIGIDLRLRKQAEDAIRRLNEDLERRVVERTAQLESFSYSVSHDLRAPLRAIDGFSRIVIEDYAPQLDNEGKRLLKVIRDNTQKMGKLIDDLLLFSRAGQHQLSLSEISMTEIVTSIANELVAAIDEKKHAPKLRLGNLAETSADISLIRQVWMNLLSNAIKFSNKKEQAIIEVDSRTEDHEHVYWVRDNGAGFDMTYAHKLFGVFQRLHTTAEFDGNGIGLAIVQRIINRHGGRVWAEGGINRGACFYFTLPTKGDCH